MSITGIRRLIDTLDLPVDLRGGVVAVGNFDGVHRGHQLVLNRALAEAGKLGRPTLMLTFEPHPRTLFQPDMPLHRLTPAPMKARLAGLLGVDAVVELGFDRAFAQHTADDFVAGILLRDLCIAHVVTGFDFHFGKGRQGGPAFLMEAGARLGFGVSLVDAFRDEGSEIVSSSRIRALLADADLGEANGLLGYRYTVEAPVIHGRQLGRTLGYPTANMAIGDDAALPPGIYAVRFRRAGGSMHDGVASFGRRPTVEDEGRLLLETHLFDFDGDLYGETCTVSFFGRLRTEEKFQSLDALMVQMRHDEAEARALLDGVQPLSGLDRLMCFG